MRQLKASCQFENRHIRDFRIGLVTEYFFEKKDIFEYSSRRCFLLMSIHKAPPIAKKQRHSPSRARDG